MGVCPDSRGHREAMSPSPVKLPVQHRQGRFSCVTYIPADMRRVCPTTEARQHVAKVLDAHAGG
jgi:hypothetical protein